MTGSTVRRDYREGRRSFGKADVLLELDVALNAQGTSLVFAELKHGVREKIERNELTREIDPCHF